MSRIGKRPIPVPAGVTDHARADGTVTVKGPKGTLVRRFNPDMTLQQEDGTLTVERPTDEKEHRALHGLTRTLVANMVEGVTKGYTKQLEDHGVGFRATMAGKTLQLNVGFSHSIEVHAARRHRRSPSPTTRRPVTRSSRSRASTRSASARPPPRSASCASRNRTRAKAFATRARPCAASRARPAARAARARSNASWTRTSSHRLRRHERPLPADLWYNTLLRVGRMARMQARWVGNPTPEETTTMRIEEKERLRRKRHRRVRSKVTGTAERPRLNVSRSLQHIYAQLIDDTTGHTLAARLHGGCRPARKR